jgi:excisionase family DNA binding protein
LSADSNGSIFLSPEQVATACGLSRRAVYRAIDRGELTAFRLCSRLRIRPNDVEAWVDANQIDPASREVRQVRPAGLPAAEGLRRLLPES